MIKQRIEEHPYRCLITLILATGLLIYAPFIFGKYIFAWADWGYDTKHGNLPMYEYLAQRIAEGRAGQYDFSFGLGTSSFVAANSFFDMFQAANTFVAGILGKKAVGYGLVFVHLLKNVVLGCIGLHYLQMFRFSKPVCIAASYVLSFCGYMMVTGQHYEFATYAVSYCLVILMCEKTLRVKKWWAGLTVSVFLMGLLGPYVSFWPLVSAGVYCAIRVLQVNGGKDFCAMLRQLAALAFYMALGLLISMPAFLPQCYEIFCVSARMQQERTLLALLKEAFSVAPKEYLKSGFFRLFSNHLQGLINSWEGPKAFFSATPYFFSLFFPFCMAHEAYKIATGEKNRQWALRFLILLLSAFCFFFALFPLASCGFAYIEYRFAFVFLPLFAWCFADTLEDLFYKKRCSPVTCILTAIFGSIFLHMLFDSENAYSILSLRETTAVLCLIACVTVLACQCKNAKAGKLLRIALCILIAASEWFDLGMELYTDRSILLKADYDGNYHMPYMEQFEQDIRGLEGDRFVRLDRTFVGYDGSPDILYSLVCPVRTASVYSNTLSRYTLEFVEKIMKKEPTIGKNQIGYALNSYGAWFDPRTADLLGLKYIVSQQDTEYAGWKIISAYEGYYLYQNVNVKSAGLVYDKYMTNEEFEKLDALSQAAVIGQAVVLDRDIKEGTSHTLQQAELKKQKLAEITASGNGQDQQNQIKAVIQAEEKELAISRNGQSQQGQMEVVVRAEEDSILRFGYQGGGNYELLNDNREAIDHGELHAAEGYAEMAIPVTKDARYLVFTPEETGDIEITDIQLYGMVLEYGHADGFFNENFGSVVEGAFHTDGEKILYMPITYDTNWKAFVNGDEVETYRADYGFTAIVLPDGENQIRFCYTNSFFYIGMAVGIVGIVIAVGLFVMQKRNVIAKGW